MASKEYCTYAFLMVLAGCCMINASQWSTLGSGLQRGRLKIRRPTIHKMSTNLHFDFRHIGIDDMIYFCCLILLGCPTNCPNNLKDDHDLPISSLLYIFLSILKNWIWVAVNIYWNTISLLFYVVCLAFLESHIFSLLN